MQHLKGFGLENFRVFKDYTWFDFAPITLLIGPNNSGKSSLIKGVLFFMEEYDKLPYSKDTEEMYKYLKQLALKEWDSNVYDNDYLQQDGFQNESDEHFQRRQIDKTRKKPSNLVQPANDIKKPFAISCFLDNSPYFKASYKFSNFRNHFENYVADTQWTIRYDDLLVWQYDRTLENLFFDVDFFKDIFDEKSRYNLFLQKIKRQPNTKNITITTPNVKNFIKDKHAKLVSEIAEEVGLLSILKNAPEKTMGNSYHENGATCTYKYDENSVSSAMIGKYFKVYHPFNDEQKEIWLIEDDNLGYGILQLIYYFYDGQPFEEEYIITISHLFRWLFKFQLDIDFPKPDDIFFIPNLKDVALKETILKKYENKQGKKSFSFINKWSEKFNFHDYDINTKKPNEFIQINGRSVLDSGSGMGQVSTFLLACCALEEKLLLLEEPEANLHPAFQSKLADMFLDAQKTFNQQFIIETHSEYMVRKFQYLVAKGEMKKEDIVIYYFHDPKENKKPTKIEILEDGRLSQPFGTGFYDETAKLMSALLTGENLN